MGGGIELGFSHCVAECAVALEDDMKGLDPRDAVAL